MGNNKVGNNLDRIFRDRLNNHEVAPNNYNWSVIESKIYRDIEKKGRSPFAYIKLAAILLATMFFSVFATKHYIASQAISNENDLTTLVSNDEAFWNYMNRISQAPTILTKEIPVIKEVTKYKYVYNEDFYKMPPNYKYKPTDGEDLLSFDDIKKLLATYNTGDDEHFITPNSSEYESFNKVEIASLDKIENYGSDTEAANTLPFIVYPVYDYSNDLSLSLDGGGAMEDSKTLIQKDINKVLNQKLVKRTGFHFGFGSTALNTWILNSQPTELQNNSVIYPFTLGHQYGGNLGFDFGSKFGVELGLYRANQGQKIAQIINLRKVQTQLRMNYLHLPLTFKYKWEQYSNLTKNSVILNYVFGFQYSRLQGYESSVNESIISKSGIQRNHDLGFVIGLEYDVFVTKNYYFTFGARSTYSYGVDEFANVFNETFNNTKANNFTVGLNASINYLIPN